MTLMQLCNILYVVTTEAFVLGVAPHMPLHLSSGKLPLKLGILEHNLGALVAEPIGLNIYHTVCFLSTLKEVSRVIRVEVVET